jgi:exosortase
MSAQTAAATAMGTAAAAACAKLLPRASWLPWLVFTAALAASCWRAAPRAVLGNGDDLMLLATTAAVLWIERAAIAASLQARGCARPWLGSALFLAGCLGHLAGRLSGSVAIEVWGLFLLPAGLVAAFAPRPYLRSALFLAGAGTVVVVIGRIAPTVLSSDLAVMLATACAALLRAAGMQVLADGVHLYFGPYSAEVTEACAGLNSIFSLTALAMLYLREGIQRPGWHIALLVACVVPVAVLTNFVRIVLLVLSTQYIGDRFAQGVFHETAGVFVFVLALALLAGIDWLALQARERLTPNQRKAGHAVR